MSGGFVLFQMSLREMGRHCAVSESYVRKLHDELSAHNAQIQKPTERVVSRGGTTYTQNTANIAKRPAPVVVEPAKGGRGKKGGVREAARQAGVPETTARRRTDKPRHNTKNGAVSVPAQSVPDQQGPIAISDPVDRSASVMSEVRTFAGGRVRAGRAILV